MEKIETSIVKMLLKNGFTQDEIDSKTPEELREIYARGVKQYIKNFSPEEEVHENIKENPFKALQNPEEIYNLSYDFFKIFSNEDIMLMIHKRFKHIPIDRIQKIVQILFCAFCEEILQEIAKKLEKIPQEEKDSLFEIYEAQKENIQHLIEINQKLDIPQFRRKLEEILHIKSSIAKQTKEKPPF